MKNEFSPKDYRSSDLQAIVYLIPPAVLTIAGLYLTNAGPWSVYYIVGQFLLGVVFFQAFILLHETGHYSYFNNRTLNIAFGFIFGFLSFIPFRSWVEIHNLHHKWTGYRDRDPTTEGTVHPKFSGFTRFIVNASWLLWIPVFTVGYRLGNYWGISKLKKHVPPGQLPGIYVNMVLQLGLYGLLFYLFGAWIVQHILLAYIISMMISDLFILSQHSHIEIPLAGDKEVKPIRYAEQVPYTRSLALFKYVGRLLYFNFNLHELHHEHPGLPAYHLDKVPYESPNKVKFFDYLKDAKLMTGMDFVFRTSGRKIGARK